MPDTISPHLKKQNTLPQGVTPAQPKPTDEFGATDKPEPTRYGDWEIGGRCVDF